MHILFDVVIVGGGASGLMCAIESAKRGRKVVVIEHNKKSAEKIRISGGGRCNFTNIDCSPKNYLSSNAHFMKSALSRYTPSDFITLLNNYKISYHEKTLGQLFCNESAQNIIDMLLAECQKYGVVILLQTKVLNVENQVQKGFEFELESGEKQYNIVGQSCVIATGGLSIPKMGASAFGYKIAEQFGLSVVSLYPALVPLTFSDSWLDKFKSLSGLSVSATVSCGGVGFKEGFLFTHRGLSGPSILQISSYWRQGQEITINFLPEINLSERIKCQKEAKPKQTVLRFLEMFLPERLIKVFVDDSILSLRIADLNKEHNAEIIESLHNFKLKPNSTEGYRTAEVTLGGVDCSELSSKTFESHKMKNLYFIGEVIDVTGWLGGYNFQWAWASGWCCGQVC